MATSLLSPGTIKYVVPWKTRDEFLSVFCDLYSGEEHLQERAIRRITLWKSRAGSKLSVAIESSGTLMQASLDHKQTERKGKLLAREALLRSSYSLALIRFVNHITEKGQTKATAQPVHLVAREFGIPEWVVRLRHDATHSSLPCLDVLSTGAQWALNYLKENFWNQQTEEHRVENHGSAHGHKSLKLSNIRRTFYDFQKARFQAQNNDNKDDHLADLGCAETLHTLHKYLTQNRLKFVKCLLEDGILIFTEEQLAVFGVSSDDLQSQLPPTIPPKIAEFWKPLLKKLNNTGTLPFLVQAALFSVSSGEGIRNYQLVAWVAFFLSQNIVEKTSRKRKKKRKPEKSKLACSLPSKTLLAACLESLNGLTAYLLKYLADKESLGADNYTRLCKLLNIHSQVTSAGSVSGDSDSDTMYTVEDIQRVKEEQRSSDKITPTTVNNIQDSIAGNDVAWRICTDVVDWAAVPFGSLHDPLNGEEDEEENGGSEDENGVEAQDNDKNVTPKEETRSHSSSSDSDDDDDDYTSSRRKTASRRSSGRDDNGGDSGTGGGTEINTLSMRDSKLL